MYKTIIKFTANYPGYGYDVEKNYKSLKLAVFSSKAIALKAKNKFIGSRIYIYNPHNQLDANFSYD